MEGRSGACSLPWFALHIRMHDHEGVEAALQHRGYEVLSPYYVATKILSTGRQKQVRTPLFPGYLFCSLDPLRQKLGVLTVPGVKRILGFGNSPAPVAGHEIDAIRRLQREVEYLLRQREILKKAMSILSEDPQSGMR